MNEQRTAVLTDSSCDVAPEFLQKYPEIHVLPMHIMYPEKDYLDGVDIDPLMTYRRFPAEFPNTSTPNIGEVQEMIEKIRGEGYDKIIAISISSGLSGTYNAIRLGAEDIEDMEIFTFDTKNVSVGTGIFVIWVAYKLHNGATYKEVCQGLRDKIWDSKVMFYMDTLAYLQRGGRIGKVTSIVGTALRLKPIISCNTDGIYYTVATIRGAKMAKKKLLDEVVKFIGDSPVWIIIGHGDAEEEAKEMERLIMERVRNKRILYIKQITATMAVNTGPGLIGVLAFKNP